MTDQIEAFGNSLIQHGKSNDRAYLMKVNPGDCPAVVDYAVALAEANDYSKVFAKASERCHRAFSSQEFVAEARVPGLFNGEEDGYFFSRFMCPDRYKELSADTVSKVLATAHNKSLEKIPEPVLEAGLTWRVLQKADVRAMATLYREVFKSYPFPIDDPDYLAETMDHNVVYHGAFQGEALIAQASAEMDCAGQNVEMTDFATRLDCRGQGLATYLLEKMEADVLSRGIKTAYTIARAYSYGMNITFAKHGYKFAGTLTNNTQIFGQLESMNVWFKPLCT